MTRTERCEKLEARVRAMKDADAAREAALAALTAAAAEAEERMRTVANLFSPSVWGLLPQKIKAFFAPYREE